MSAGTAVIELRNDLVELGRLAGELEAFCDRHAVAPRTRGEVNLALEELVTNIISHAFDDDGREHLIRIELQADGRQVVARVEDDGRPFDPTKAEEPDLEVPLEERRVGGLGILLVRTLMDDVRYTRERDRNVVVVTRSTGESRGDRPAADRPGKQEGCV